MTTTPHIPLRAVRDRLLELLGIGLTYPLRDLAVRNERLTVAYNATAKIPIEESQEGVLYQLRRNGQPVARTADEAAGAGLSIEAAGNGGGLILETNPIHEDVIFQIYARKPVADPHQRYRGTYLHQTATVKVGLDSQLPAQILDAPFLDQDAQRSAPDAPRLVDYGREVKVEIQNSQEEVDYRLVYFRAPASGQQEEEVELSEEKQGNLHNLTLTTKPVEEDMEIHIRATRTFDASEGSETQSTLLAAVLPLRVRANPELPVTVDPTAVIDYLTTATVTVGNTQPTVRYRLLSRPLTDHDFVRQPGQDGIAVVVEGEETVQIRRPAPNDGSSLPGGFSELPDSSQDGTGGELRFALPSLAEDCLVVVQAHKEHVAQPGQGDQPARRVPSSIQLEQAAAILVRPNPAQGLRCRVWIEGKKTTGDLLVAGGEPGVFYYFAAPGADKESLGLPAYFHRRHDHDEGLNKGIDQLAVEVDFVVARPLAADLAGGDLAVVPPEPPLLETRTLRTGSTLHIRAVKAQTRVATPLDNTLEIPAGPEGPPTPILVDYGARAAIPIKRGKTNEMYQLFQDGLPLGDPVKRTTKNQVLETGELRQDTTFELLVSQPDAPLALERVFRIEVLVRPDPSREVRAGETVIDPETAATVTVAASQPGVVYQLLVGDEASGEPVAGGGEAIDLTSGPLTVATTFTVRATRVAYPELFVPLTEQIHVEVRSAAEPEPDQ
jgi:hypothetical protein